MCAGMLNALWELLLPCWRAQWKTLLECSIGGRMGPYGPMGAQREKINRFFPQVWILFDDYNVRLHLQGILSCNCLLPIGGPYWRAPWRALWRTLLEGPMEGPMESPVGGPYWRALWRALLEGPTGGPYGGPYGGPHGGSYWRALLEGPIGHPCCD